METSTTKKHLHFAARIQSRLTEPQQRPQEKYNLEGEARRPITGGDFCARRTRRGCQLLHSDTDTEHI